MDENILQKLHGMELEILDEYMRICDAHNLAYYMTGGTLLGAVRHRGFIPWDDDIDIGMPRADFERFIDICKTELNEKYYLMSYRTSEPYWYHFIKLCRKNTVFLEYAYLDENETNGIFIDIFPYDNVVKFPPVQLIMELVITFFKKAIRGKIKAQKKLIKNKILIFIFNRLNFKSLQFSITRVMTLWKNTNTKYLGCIIGGYGFKKETFTFNTIFPVRKLKFENREVNAPNDYGTFLSTVYGSNYMELPPMEKRVSHNPILLVFDTGKKSTISHRRTDGA